jgi:hypothetical protein
MFGKLLPYCLRLLDLQILFPLPPPRHEMHCGRGLRVTHERDGVTVVLCRRHSCVVWQRGGPQQSLTFVDR